MNLAPRPVTLALALCAAALAGCHLIYPFGVVGSDAGAADGDGGSCDSAQNGRACSAGGQQCTGGAVCVIGTKASKVGVCACPCSYLDQTSCGDASRYACGKFTKNSVTYELCFQLCQPRIGADSCDGELICHPSSGAQVKLRDKTVCLLTGCGSDKDCPLYTTKPCTTSAKCAAGESCSSWYQVCITAGKCDLTSGLCAAHGKGNPAAKVGDPCKGDTECAGKMTCLMEAARPGYAQPGQACTTHAQCCNNDCVGGKCSAQPCIVDFRNGYCTIEGCRFASSSFDRYCPKGSSCNLAYRGGLCQKTCSIGDATTCRGNTSDLWGDYECRDWSKLSLAGQPYADGPLCDFGAQVTCANVGSCNVLGDAANSTHMSCRSLKDQAKPEGDKQGYCLDDTASGTTTRP